MLEPLLSNSTSLKMWLSPNRGLGLEGVEGLTEIKPITAFQLALKQGSAYMLVICYVKALD